MLDLTYELRKCRDCSCSRCYLNGSKDCYIEMAIRELNRFEQAFDAFEDEKENNV